MRSMRPATTRAATMVAVLAALGVSLAGADRPAVTRGAIAAVEKNIDRKLERDVLDNNQYLLLGMTRGVYLSGYGAVFTAEASLSSGASPSPFRSLPPKAEIDEVHQRKLARYPVLKKAMREMLVSAAASLDTVPAEEKVVLGVALFFYSWEETSGLPRQVVMLADRKTLVDMQTQRRSPAELESSITVREF